MARLGRGQPFRPVVLKPAATIQVTFSGSGGFVAGVPSFVSSGTETLSASGAVTYQATFSGVGTSFSATGAFAIGASFSGVGSIPVSLPSGGGGMAPGTAQWRGRIVERPREPAIALVLADDEEDFAYLLALTQGGRR